MLNGTNPKETPPPLESNHQASLESQPAFICTICWQRQPRGSRPKLLGTSARIVCRACWRAVLDLSICWVCGECIVRGDEVVSLGWCFWHRGCFGCLVCGTRLDVPVTVACSICSEGDADKKGEWGKLDGSEDEVGRSQSARCIGVELEEIPMCTVCEIETAGESTDQVLARGLETVTKFDGGLSRSRIDMLSEAEEGMADVDVRSPQQRSGRYSRRIRGAVRTEEGLKSLSKRRSDSHAREVPLHAEDMSPLLDNAADMGISEDGSIDDRHSQSDTEVCDLRYGRTSTNQESAASVVYVSVLDPVGEPAFRPSKTKPLPKWMNLLPSNIHRERERRARTAAELTKRSHETQQMREGTISYASDGSGDFDIETPSSGSTAVSPAGETKRQTALSRMDLSQKPQTRQTIAFEPRCLGGTAEDSACKSIRRSQTAYSTCSTTQEYPCSHPSRPQTPYPRSPYPSRPPITRNETTSYFSYRPSIAAIDDAIDEQFYSPDSLPESPDPYNAMSPMRDFLSALDTSIDFPAPSQSSEYLDRYQPKTAETKHEKYIAGEAEPILEKIKRQKVGTKVNTDSAKDSKKDSKGKAKMLVEEFGLDPRKKDLNKELKNLFCEEQNN